MNVEHNIKRLIVNATDQAKDPSNHKSQMFACHRPRDDCLFQMKFFNLLNSMVDSLFTLHSTNQKPPARTSGSTSQRYTLSSALKSSACPRALASQWFNYTRFKIQASHAPTCFVIKSVHIDRKQCQSWSTHWESSARYTGLTSQRHSTMSWSICLNASNTRLHIRHNK